MDKLGLTLIAVGTSLADSECLIVPISIVALGFCILWRGGYVG